MYIVNCERENGHRTLRGIPVVVADSQFDGVEEGIYEKYKDPKYGSKASYTLLDRQYFNF